MNTTSLPAAILLFGVAGVGKTYLGSIISQPLGYFHYELDSDLTPEMKAALEEGREFTDRMRDDFFIVVAGRMREMLLQHQKVIFTQGAYKERHRAFLREQIPGLECVWVTAPQEVIQQRLRSRGGAVTEGYAKLIHRNFEPPTSGSMFINDISLPEDILARFMGLF